MLKYAEAGGRAAACTLAFLAALSFTHVLSPPSCGARELGEEILVNDDTTGGCPHGLPDVTITSDGNSLVVWYDDRHGDYDANIYCQCYDSNGASFDTNRVINGDTASRNIWDLRQVSPAVTALANGMAAVCWQDYRRGEPSIYRLLNHRGYPTGPEFAVPTLGDSQSDPDIAGIKSRFVLVWKQTSESSGATIRAAIAESTGRAISDFAVSTSAPGETCGDPSVAGYDQGFVVAWCQWTSSKSVMMRWFDAQGNPRGPASRVEFDDACRPRVAADSQGNTVAVWEEAGASPTGIWAIAYDSAGLPRGQVLRVSQPLGAYAYLPAIAGEPGGRNFLVVWEDGRSGGPFIYGRSLDSLGVPRDSDFRIDASPSATAQSCPAVAINGDGRYFAVWVDYREACENIYGKDNRTSTSQIIRVNDDRASSIHDFPVVTMDSSGRTSVFWFDYRADAQHASIYGQRYDKSLHPLGDNFRVSEVTHAQAWFFWATTNSSGTTAVVWEDYRNGDADIYGQLYDARGNPRGTNFRVNDDPGNATQVWPTVAMNDSGYFVVAWNDARTGPFAPFVQRFDPAGNRMGGNQQVGASCEHAFPLLFDSGDLWVAWGGSKVSARHYDIYRQSWDSTITITDSPRHRCVYPRLLRVGNSVWAVWMDTLRGNWDVYAQRMGLDFRRIGPNFRVNDDTVVCEHWLPSIAYDGRNRVIIAWCDFRKVGNLDLRARAYDTCGVPLDTSFVVNTDVGPNDHQWAYRSVAASKGRVVYGWTDNRLYRSWDVFIRPEVPDLPRGRNRYGLVVRPSVSSTCCRIAPAFPISGAATIRVFDIAGRRVRAFNDYYQLSERQNSILLDCHGFVPGIYVVLLDVGAGFSFSGKLAIVQ